MQSPYQVVQDFEKALCEYTGAPFAVTTTSCTMALLLACKWHNLNQINALRSIITIPKHTYVSVPMSINHAGFNVEFEGKKWAGGYQLQPHPIWDYARWFSSGMFDMITASEVLLRREGIFNKFQCVSFHWSKTLSIGQGGAILHNNPEADKWFRKARFDGRTEGVDPRDDDIDMIGYHCYMSPRDAAEGLSRLAVLPKHNDPLPNSDYPDLSKMRVFQ